MDFELTEQQKALQTKVRQFIQRVITPLESKIPYDPQDTPDDVVQHVKNELMKAGFYSMNVPKEYGGQGWGLTDKFLVIEEFLRSGVELLWHGELRIVSVDPPPHVWVEATESQKKEYFLPAVRGERAYTYAASEPGMGSDLVSMQTTAVKKGDTYVINGTKRWTESLVEQRRDKNGFVIVYAKTKPEAGTRGISSFLVDYGNPGMRESRIIETWKTGSERKVCDLTFENCVVPASALLGEENMAFRRAREHFNQNILTCGPGLVGMMQRTLDMATAYAKKRVAFGKPIAEHEAIAWMLADSAVDIHMARLLTYHAAWAQDNGQDTRQYVAMIKGWIPDMACRVIDRAIQIHGGIGIAKETGLGRMYVLARSLKIEEGTAEIYHIVLSRCILQEGWPLSLW